MVNLTALMKLTSGSPEIAIGLSDGPVAIDHPGLVGANMRPVSGRSSGLCSRGISIPGHEDDTINESNNLT